MYNFLTEKLTQENEVKLVSSTAHKKRKINREMSGEKAQNLTEYFTCNSSDSDDGDKPIENTHIDQVKT